jgi:hypothetical protein
MTLTQLAMAYGTVAVCLLIPFVILLVRQKSEVKKAFTLPDWTSYRLSFKEAFSAQLGLKLLLTTFITLCMGVIVALTALSYGTAWAVAAALIALIILCLLPKVLE